MQLIISGEYPHKKKVVLSDDSEISWKISSKEASFLRKTVGKRKKEGKPLVLWGWKRDKVIEKARYPESRTVYFSADLEAEKSGHVFMSRGYLFLDTRAKNEEIKKLLSDLKEKDMPLRYVIKKVSNDVGPQHAKRLEDIFAGKPTVASGKRTGVKGKSSGGVIKSIKGLFK